jgi:hypothetical protein
MVRVDAWNRDEPIFEDMEADPDKFHPLAWLRAGITHCDAIIDPMYAADSGVFGLTDSLYAYRAAGPDRKNRYSEFEDRLCAIRWHDPDPARTQGRTMWFGFPLYFMKTDQAQDTFNRAIDWFREEETRPPVRNY